MENLKTGKILLTNTKYIIEVFDGYTYFKENDILIAKVTPCFENKNIAIAKNLRNGIGFGSTEINVFRTNSECETRFYYYFFQSNKFINISIPQMIGTAGLKRVPSEFLLNLKLPLPPKVEQIQIADFLDKKTAQIDKAITLKEQLIERLKERRQILINDAVTKGLDKTVKMKDSGIEWIGEIPEHWEVRKLKYCMTLQNNKIDIQNKIVVALENIESWTGKIIPSRSKYSGEGIQFKKNDILFGKLRPYLAKVHKAEYDGIAFGDILVFSPHKGINSLFSFYLMISKSFISVSNSSTYGTKMPRVSPVFIKSIEVPLPPLEEQKQIAKHLDEQTKKIDTAIELQQKQIEKLKEYRMSLIDSVVTGKVKIMEDEYGSHH